MWRRYPKASASLVVDSPGTGQAPLKAGQGETSERIPARAGLICTRPEIDKSRIVVHGQSFGAYWAAKLAHVEAKRLAGAVAQSPPIHRTFFQADFFRSRMYTREYLFDLRSSRRPAPHRAPRKGRSRARP